MENAVDITASFLENEAANRIAPANKPRFITPGSSPRFIHLLYVPTNVCSLRCSYCYLDHESLLQETSDPAHRQGKDPLTTLSFAIEKLQGSNIMPFTLSLHGGEVTCLSPERFESLVSYIDSYYRKYGDFLREHGFKVGKPHIKTNLYNIDKHLEALARHEVSISGSLDVPFSLHKKYRRTAGGQDTLDKILQNVELLRDLPCRKKISTTIFKEHLNHIDEMIEDLWYLHRETCLDMNDFNFMIGFSDDASLPPLTEDDQLAFYKKMHAEFDGTELDKGVNGAWFAEFTPNYCTGSVNCGEKFFLLDYQGNIYSCVRGQGHKDFYYGNIFSDSVETILNNARTKIFTAHNKMPLSSDCIECDYLRLCMTGCPFVKSLYGSAKSYTCKLQQKMYEDNPTLYKPTPDSASDAYHYALAMRPLQAESLRPKPAYVLPNKIPSLLSIIEADKEIAGVFVDDAFIIEVDGILHSMQSQVLRTTRELVSITPVSTVKLYAKETIFNAACKWPVNNSLYLMLLSGELVTYGDENRTKQEHVMTHQIFLRTLASMPSELEGFYCFDASELLSGYYQYLSTEKPNNLFVTTSALRDAHYSKHKNNAYYHIQTINLPFPNIELLCEDDSDQNANASLQEMNTINTKNRNDLILKKED